MEQLISLLKQKAGLTDEQAKSAAQATMDYLKEKFPHVLHSELDKIAAGGDFGDAARAKFESMKDKLEDTAKQIGSKAGTLAEEMKDKLNEMFGPKKTS